MHLVCIVVQQSPIRTAETLRPSHCNNLRCIIKKETLPVQEINSLFSIFHSVILQA